RADILLVDNRQAKLALWGEILLQNELTVLVRTGAILPQLAELISHWKAAHGCIFSAGGAPVPAGQARLLGGCRAISRRTNRIITSNLATKVAPRVPRCP